MSEEGSSEAAMEQDANPSTTSNENNNELPKDRYQNQIQETNEMEKSSEGGDGSSIQATEVKDAVNQGQIDTEDSEKKQEVPPSYDTQKSEIQPILSSKLKKGDEWYLIDQRWLKQWKKYVGYDSWDQYSAGKDNSNPGPVDNSNMFENFESDVLKDHLMEELDYALLPKAAWEKLISWYTLTPGSKAICRRVVEYGTYVKHLKVEVYLFSLKVCVHPHVNEAKQAQFSRADTVQETQEKIRLLFEISEDTEVRLWQRYMTNSYELMKDSSQSLADAGIYGGQMLMLECKNKEGRWPRDSSSSTGGSSSYGASSQSATTGYSSSSSSSSYSYYDRRQEPSVPGICGLSNLGNTCFMNSALQCLSNTQSLTEYFMGKEGVEKPYKKHINKDNPLGMKGALAETYGDLLDMLWSGENSYLAPRQFKMMIGRHAPQFSGYQQHDSHELLAFLLDGLHEDLNLVRKKPYVDMEMKTEDRTDKDIAEETWHKYLLRNQSVIVRLFQGQLKSTLNCPKCQKMSRIFDPFMYLSLPLPIKKTREIFVYLVRSDPTAGIVRYRLTVPKGGQIVDLKQAMQKVEGIDPKNLVVIDVYHSRFHRVYYDRDAISQIMDRDDIYLYELTKPLGDQDWVPIPVYMREIRVQKSYFSSSTTYGQVFGLPIVITVSRDGCTYRELYKTVLKQIGQYVTLPTEQQNNERNNTNSDAEKKDESDNVEEMEVQSTREPEPSDQDNKDEDEGVVAEEQGDAEETAGNTSEPMETSENNDSKNDEDNTTSSNKKDDKNDEDDTTEEKKDNKDLDNREEKQQKKEAEEDDDNEEEKEDGRLANGDLFKLTVVNSYGSQEVQQLKDTGKMLKLTSQTYVSCDWKVEAKEKYYDVKKAEEYEEDESCREVLEKKKEINIYDCLELFVHQEELGEEDAWYCPRCKDFVQAFKKFDLWKLPEVLVIHLKRFSYSRWWRNKIESKVHFPLTNLDLSDYVVNEEHEKPVYDLFAVSNHFGGLGGGHYTAYCKNKVTGKWYSFDDSHVSESDESSVCSSSSYVLFYARQSDGQRSTRRGVDRSLSVSFDEEVDLGRKKFNRSSDSQPMDTSTSSIKEEDNEGGANNNDTVEDGDDDAINGSEV